MTFLAEIIPFNISPKLELLFSGRIVTVFFAKLVNTTGCIQQFLFAGEKRVAL